MAEPGDAAAFIRHTPFAVDVAIFSRLSPKCIICMTAVCRAWNGKLRRGALLSYLHGLERPRPLICFDRVACPNRYAQLRDYCVESLDLRSDKLRSVLRFTDNEDCDFDEYDLEGRRYAPPIDEFRVDYERMEKHGQGDMVPLLVHGSLHGHLLVSCLDGWYVTNPATRKWVALPNLSCTDVVGFYYSWDYGQSSGEYRVLCFCREETPAVYGVLKVTTLPLRVIGIPISPDAPADHGLALGVEPSCLSPSIQLTSNRHLHWAPQQRQGYQILVFNTEREEFSWKRPAPVRDEDMRLLELPDGHLGLSVSGVSKPTLELWRLQDYQNEVWVRMYRIRLALQQIPVLQEERVWLSGVVSEGGDVLIQSRQWLLHCDRNGNLLRQFWIPHRLFLVKHMLRESIIPHPMFAEPKIDGATQPSFFHGLCDDPIPSS